MNTQIGIRYQLTDEGDTVLLTCRLRGGGNNGSARAQERFSKEQYGDRLGAALENTINTWRQKYQDVAPPASVE